MPLKFEIYRDGQRLTTYQPVGAMVLGPESTAMMGEVAWRDGLLTARCDDEHPIAVSLLWDLGPLGAQCRAGPQPPDADRSEAGGLESF
jgi:hypothetical protein